MISGRFLYRSGQKKHYIYSDSAGRVVPAKSIPEHFTHMAVPPAWKDVRLSRSEAAKVWATGIDDAGRKQYLYNPKFRASQPHYSFWRSLTAYATRNA